MSSPACAATLQRGLRRLDRQAVEAALGGWVEEVLAATPPVSSLAEVLTLDGKVLRGRTQGASRSHLLSALAPRLGLIVAQAAVDDKTNEITAMPGDWRACSWMGAYSRCTRC